MLRILDRYVIREVTPPIVLSLVVFTFLLILDPIMDYAEPLLSRGVPLLTVLRLILTLVPQALGIALPVALLVGLLIGLGRLSGDREVVALLAGGVSPYRLLRSIGAVAAMTAAATLWVMIVAIPDANQTFREITFNIIAERAQHDIQPRVFFEDFPNKVLYVRDAAEAGVGWKGVFLADTSRPGWPTVYLAGRGRLSLDRDTRKVDLVLESGAQHTQDEVLEFGSQIIGLDPESIFPRSGPQRGINEMTIADLRAQIQLREGQKLPVHNEVMAIHQKFAFPVACLVFGLTGLALGVTSRKDGKLAGFVIGMGVVLLYWAIHILAEAMARGQALPAAWARWMPILVLGPLATAAMVWKARWTEGRLPGFLPRLATWSRRQPGAGPHTGDLATRSTSRRVVLVVRVPRLGLPAPGILDRYIIRIYLRIAGLTFLGLLCLFYIADFIDRSAYLFKGQTSSSMLVAYFWHATPQFVYYVLPLSILIGTLVTVGLLTKTSELTVIKACGVSLYRSAAPLLLLAFLASGVLFVLEESVLAVANQRADALNRTMRGRPPRTFNPANPNWLVGKDAAIYHYTLFDPDRHRLVGLSVYRFDQAGQRLLRETWVERAEYAPGGWIASAGRMRTYGGPGSKLASQTEHFVNRRLDLEPPEYFETERTSAQMMTFSQLRRHVAELQTSGFSVTRYRVDLQRKLAFPFVAVIMALVAVPFAVTTGRRGALYGIGLGIILAIGYWLLTSLFAAIGTAGLLAPALAAWAPNVLFGAGAVYLILTVRT